MNKPRRVNLSCTVPAHVAADLQKVADEEGHLMSRKLCKIITDYIKSEKGKHPALVVINNPKTE